MTGGRFPRQTLRGDRLIHRIHRAGRDPWWFSTDGRGRFDPVGTRMGAVYFAELPLGAWVEVFRKQMLLAEAEIAERALFTVALGRDARLADLTSRRALAFGVTASLGADQDYGASQALAGQALAGGFAGVRYLLRHDRAQRLYGIALFGEPGAGGQRPSGSDDPIPDDLVAEAQRSFGYRVVPLP